MDGLRSQDRRLPRGLDGNTALTVMSMPRVMFCPDDVGVGARGTPGTKWPILQVAKSIPVLR